MRSPGVNSGDPAIVDVPGVGGGVVDRLAELDLPVVSYNGGEATIDMERFDNAPSGGLLDVARAVRAVELSADGALVVALLIIACLL
jgi:hypothetical protein